MYYPSSENKGADQLHGYREADLRLCFRICRLLVFSRGGSFGLISGVLSLNCTSSGSIDLCRVKLKTIDLYRYGDLLEIGTWKEGKGC